MGHSWGHNHGTCRRPPPPQPSPFSVSHPSRCSLTPTVPREPLVNFQNLFGPSPAPGRAAQPHLHDGSGFPWPLPSHTHPPLEEAKRPPRSLSRFPPGKAQPSPLERLGWPPRPPRPTPSVCQPTPGCSRHCPLSTPGVPLPRRHPATLTWVSQPGMESPPHAAPGGSGPTPCRPPPRPQPPPGPGSHPEPRAPSARMTPTPHFPDNYFLPEALLTRAYPLSGCPRPGMACYRLGGCGHMGLVPVGVQRDAQLLPSTQPRWTCCLASQHMNPHPCTRPVCAWHSQHTRTDTPAPIGARAQCTPGPSALPAHYPEPSHTQVTHTARRARSLARSCHPRHPRCNRRPSCCLPPLPAGVFAKQFPWRHILALTGTDKCREDSLHGGDEARGLCPQAPRQAQGVCSQE